MKSWLLCRGYLLLSIISFASIGRLHAQSFTVLHSFSATATNSAGVLTNNDGSAPLDLVLSGSMLYGVANGGGALGYGSIFAINSDGTGFTNLHHFAGSPGDGANPVNMIISSNIFYGATAAGGSEAQGRFFTVHTDGTGYKNLISFNTDGATPGIGAISSENVLYGVSANGGPFSTGTVFDLNSNGAGFFPLHTFSPLPVPDRPPPANADGAYPNNVILTSNNLYGTTYTGGSGGGTVYAIKTDGTGFSVLYAFTPLPLFGFANNDGAGSLAGLVLSGNRLYGTAYDGGSAGYGTVFAVNIDGTGFGNLHSFQGLAAADGANPRAPLTLSGTTLYGTTLGGGSVSGGTLFKINTDGSGYATLYSFSGTNDGGSPLGAMACENNNLYGTTSAGGAGGSGTIFRLNLASAVPQLKIVIFGTEATLTWPTNYTGYTLVTTTNVASPAWDTVPSIATVVNGEYSVKVPLSVAPQFYRLND